MKYEIPKLKKGSLNSNYTLPLDVETKQELLRLKKDNDLNIAEWLRQLIQRELPKVKAALNNSCQN